MFTATSLLFVPGSRPDRFEKAGATGAGLTVIDLEDAVPPAEKIPARQAALDHMADAGAGWALRINPVTTAAGIRDLAALADADFVPDTLLLPMVESPAEPDIVARALESRAPGIVPLVETPRGLRHALEIARANNVVAVMFGGGDFAGELGVELAWEPLLAARQGLVLACAEAGVPAIDVPFVGLDDEAGLAQECARARAIGFAAKAAIHPRQLSAIETAFAPNAAELAEAREALVAYEAGGGGAIRFRGRMLEAPLVKHYRAVLARGEDRTDA